jgi:hypothetical protein
MSVGNLQNGCPRVSHSTKVLCIKRQELSDDLRSSGHKRMLQTPGRVSVQTKTSRRNMFEKHVQLFVCDSNATYCLPKDAKGKKSNTE